MFYGIFLTEPDQLAPFGRHMRQCLKLGDDSGDVPVNGGVRSQEVEISDKEGDA